MSEAGKFKFTVKVGTYRKKKMVPYEMGRPGEYIDVKQK